MQGRIDPNLKRETPHMPPCGAAHMHRTHRQKAVQHICRYAVCRLECSTWTLQRSLKANNAGVQGTRPAWLGHHSSTAAGSGRCVPLPLPSAVAYASKCCKDQLSSSGLHLLAVTGGLMSDRSAATHRVVIVATCLTRQMMRELAIEKHHDVVGKIGWPLGSVCCWATTEPLVQYPYY
jgi:hypothetical protein